MTRLFKADHRYGSSNSRCIARTTNFSRVPYLKHSKDFKFEDHSPDTEWAFVKNHHWQNGIEHNGIKTTSPLEYAFHLLKTGNTEKIRNAILESDLLTTDLRFRSNDFEPHYSSRWEFIISGVRAINEVANNFYEEVGDFTNATVLLIDPLVWEIFNFPNDALKITYEPKNLHTDYRTYYDNHKFKMRLVEENEILENESRVQTMGTYIWHPAPLMRVINRNYAIGENPFTDIKEHSYNGDPFKSLVLKATEYDAGVTEISEFIAENGIRSIFFWKPSFIKRFLKEEKDTYQDLSTVNTAKYGVLTFGEFEEFQASKFWTSNKKSFDSIKVGAFVNSIFNWSYDSSRLSSYIDYLSVRGVVRFRETSPGDLSSLTFKTQEEWTVANSISTSPNKLLSIRRVLINQFLQDGYTEILKMTIELEGLGKLEKINFIRGLIEDWFETRIKEFQAIHTQALGGTVDHTFLQTTKFADYLPFLTASQHSKLRLAINKGEVNEDVLNFQPFSVWLLLNINIGLARIKNKKKKIFDGLKWKTDPPAWLMNKIFTAPEEVTQHSLMLKKSLYKLVRLYWNDSRSFLWVLHQEPKIFSSMSDEALIRVMEHQSLMYQTENLDVDRSDPEKVPGYLARVFGYMERRGIRYPAGDKDDIPLDFNRSKIKSLYTEWQDLLGSSKGAKKKAAVDWKQHCITLKSLLEFLFSEGLTNEAVSCPTGNWKQKERNEDHHYGGDRYYPTWWPIETFKGMRGMNSPYRKYSHINSLFEYGSFLYSSLTGQRPFDSWGNWQSFVWQMNKWIEEAQHLEPYLEYGTAVLKGEAYILTLIQESGSWFTSRDYVQNRYAYRQNLRPMFYSDSLLGDLTEQQRDSGLNPPAYRGVLQMWGLFLTEFRGIGEEGVVDLKQLARTVFKPISPYTNTFYSKNGKLKAVQIINALDLKAEGKAMHHCVGSYVDNCANGRSIIFHISGVEDPADKTLHSTLEWNAGYQEDKYRQGGHYSYNNRSPDAQVQAFGKWFLKKVNDMEKSLEWQFFQVFLKSADKLAVREGYSSFKKQCTILTDVDSKLKLRDKTSLESQKEKLLKKINKTEINQSTQDELVVELVG